MIAHVSSSTVRDMAVGLMVLWFCSVLPASAAQAKPHLRDVAEIENTLFVVAVANEVDKQCDSIRGRRLKGFNMLLNLRTRANRLGYSDAEIRAYVESDAEKDRMRAKGYKFLQANGVDANSPETFCVFGRAEIEKSSAIGALLRAR